MPLPQTPAQRKWNLVSLYPEQWSPEKTAEYTRQYQKQRTGLDLPPAIGCYRTYMGAQLGYWYKPVYAVREVGLVSQKKTVTECLVMGWQPSHRGIGSWPVSCLEWAWINPDDVFLYN